MTQQQRTEYASGTAESTALISPFKWRLLVVGFLLLLLFGAVLAAALTKGLADPARAARLTIDLASIEDLEAGFIDRVLVSSLETVELPVTIEVEAESSEVWGIWLDSPAAEHTFRVRSEGYFRTSFGGGWLEFIHIQPSRNKLYLHINGAGNAIFRINDEIAWTGTLPPDLSAWGVLHNAGSPTNWRSIRLYTSDE